MRAIYLAHYNHGFQVTYLHDRDKIHVNAYSDFVAVARKGYYSKITELVNTSQTIMLLSMFAVNIFKEIMWD